MRRLIGEELEVWPTDRWRRLCVSHLKPWRMDCDGFYVRHLSLRHLGRMHTRAGSALMGHTTFFHGRRLYCRDEAAVLGVNAFLRAQA